MNDKDIQIPLIDFASLVAGCDKQRASMKTCVSEIGFARVYNTPIESDVLADVLMAYGEFFASAQSIKSPVDQRLTRSNRGWGQSGSEQVNQDANPDYKEFYDSGHEFAADFSNDDKLCLSPNQWPDLQNFKPRVLRYYQAASDTAFALLGAALAAAGLQVDYFDQSFDAPMALLRCNRYPERPADLSVKDFGIAEHTDYGCLTLLATDGTPGLEINKRDGTWVKVATDPGEYIINFGEMLQHWSKGQVRATPHRVVGTNKERFSIALFFNPNADTNIQPSGWQPQSAEDYLQARYEETYLHLAKS